LPEPYYAGRARPVAPFVRAITLFLSHGAPMLADDARWTAELARWEGTFEEPKNILMISAQWEGPVRVSPEPAEGPADPCRSGRGSSTDRPDG